MPGQVASAMLPLKPSKQKSPLSKSVSFASPLVSIASVRVPSSESFPTSAAVLPSAAKIDRKRQREFDSDALPKAKKVVEPIATQFTDLNIDCLEHLFGYLDIITLFNVADLTASTMTAAALVYSKRYSNHLVKICGFDKPSLIEINDSVISSSSVAICSKFLSVFSDSIKKLQLEYFSNEQLTGDWATVKQLIHEKCVENVTELKLVNCGEELFAGAQRALVNVKFLRISCSRLGICIELDKWFPGIEQLELMHNDGCIQIASNFPYLCFLAVDGCLKSIEIETMLKSAPQLKSLRLKGGIDPSLLRLISQILPDLKELRLWDFDLAADQEEIIRFKSIETLHISTGYLGILPTTIPFEFERLKEVRLVIFSLGIDWIEFFMKNCHVEKLQINTCLGREITDDQLDQLATILTELKELDIVGDVTADGLSEFMAQSESLQKVRITRYAIEHDSLEKSAGNEWCTTREPRSIVFERKMK